MPSPQAIAELEKELLDHEKQASEHANRAHALRQALAILKGDVILVAPDDGNLPNLKGLGIVDASKRLLKELGEPMGTGDITRELLKRGWETESKKPVATVYATLDNSPDFLRVGGAGRKGKWTIKEKDLGRT